MAKTVEEWMDVFNTTPSPSTETVEETIGRTVAASLGGYRFISNVYEDDMKNLANAMRAYCRLMQEHGVEA